MLMIILRHVPWEMFKKNILNCSKWGNAKGILTKEETGGIYLSSVWIRPYGLSTKLQISRSESY